MTFSPCAEIATCKTVLGQKFDAPVDAGLIWGMGLRIVHRRAAAQNRLNCGAFASRIRNGRATEESC